MVERGTTNYDYYYVPPLVDISTLHRELREGKIQG